MSENQRTAVVQANIVRQDVILLFKLQVCERLLRAELFGRLCLKVHT